MALFEFGFIALFLLILVVVVVGALLLWGIKHAIWLAMNSVIGFFALYAFKAWLIPSLAINFWSVLIVAVFGLFGLVAVLLLHLVGLWF